MAGRRHSFLFILSLAGVLASCQSMPVGNPRVPEPAKAVELGRYAGRWHEIARYENRFERGCTRVTADYALLPDGKIRVLNRCMKDAKEDLAEGKAKVTPDSGNAKLKVSFFGPFYIGDYWVLDRAEDYSWSIVGEPSGKYLWILAREPRLSAEKKAALWARVRELGYDMSLLHETSQ